MRAGYAAPLAAILTSSVIASASVAHNNLPTTYMYAIIQKISVKHPGWTLVSLSTTTDLTKIVEVCGQLDSGGKLVPFFMTVIPGEPPTPTLTISGANDRLEEVVRSMCDESGLPID